VTAQFQPGDRVRHKPLMGDGGAPIGTVVRAYSEDSVWVRWSDEDAHEDHVGNIVHVAVTAEHVGQWARITDPSAGVLLTSLPLRVIEVTDGDVRLRDDADGDWGTAPEYAVLVAAPSPVPAPEWMPTVGARALVAVAEWVGISGRRHPAGSLSVDDTVEVIYQADDGNWYCQNVDKPQFHGKVSARHLRAVPVAPAPDQDDEPEDWRDAAFRAFYEDWQQRAALALSRVSAPAPDQDGDPAALLWRVGGNYNLHSYADEPWDVDPSKDRPVATFHRPADAALAVSRVNAHAALTARAEHAEAEMQRLAAEVEDWKHSRKGWKLDAEQYKAERDAARAELAAAHAHDADGLGLPDLPEPPRLPLIDLSLSSYEATTRILDTLVAQTCYADDLIRRLRARLADEATPDKETQR